MMALSGPSGSPDGGGTFLTICSRISSIPIPSLAEHGTASEASRPITSSISRRTSATSALGRSILLIDRDDLEIVVERQVDVGERLRLDALGGVDDQDGPLAGG